MPYVDKLPENVDYSKRLIPVRLDRHTLQKKRWRTTAEDGLDIAVDLEHICHNGDTILEQGDFRYVIEQEAERVIQIELPTGADKAAQLGWTLGNQHLPIEVKSDRILIAYDEPLLAKLERLSIKGQIVTALFTPPAHSHHHHHHG